MNYQIKSYPDGGKYVVINEPFEELVYRINSYEDLFLLKSLKDANPNLKRITIPCMFQQQHDRRFSSNESFELKLVCDFINSCNFERVSIFHPHSDVTPALINNCEVISNNKFIAEVILSLYPTAIDAEKSCVLMSTDAGGFKPLMKLCNDINWQGETYSASKSRQYINGESILTQVVDKQDFEGKDVLIIDDICVYGGTFIGLANLLKQRNVGKLYLAVSHLTIKKPSYLLESGFEQIFTTNSKGFQYLNVDENTPQNLTTINLFNDLCFI